MWIYGKTTKRVTMESLLEIENKLNEMGCTLHPYKEEDESSLYAIFKEVVENGSQFPYECSSLQEFHRQFFAAHSQLYVCLHKCQIIGGFFIRPNFTGRSNHIANAAYMIHSSYRGRGIGKLLVSSSLHIAKKLGFRSMQYNMVLSQNIGAIALYLKL